MGHSRICNFWGELRCGTKGCTVGIDTIKQARGWINSDNSVNPGMGQIDAVYMKPQTAYGRRIAKGYYCLKLTKAGIEYLNIEQLV